MKILFIGRGTNSNNAGGDYGTNSHIKLLKEAFPCEKIDFLYITPISLKQKIFNLVSNKGYGYKSNMHEKIKHIKNESYDMIFCNSSVYGWYAKQFKTKKTQIYTFFQNVEYVFYLHKYRYTKKVLDYVWFKYIHMQEKMAIKYSSYLIALSERDSNDLKKIYNRNADFLLPIFFRKKNVHNDGLGKFCLFIGSDFFANIEGLKWYIEKVSNNIVQQTYVIGTCCKTIDKIMNMNNYPNVKLLGKVDDLEKYYLDASCVVIPIFSGSGMKTKTIEALMYAKTVFGTNEAFAGIQLCPNKIGGLCNNEEEFISSINEYINHSNKCFNNESYKVFLNEYSWETNLKRFKSIFK